MMNPLSGVDALTGLPLISADSNILPIPASMQST
jgi:hypothetical protein